MSEQSRSRRNGRRLLYTGATLAFVVVAVFSVRATVAEVYRVPTAVVAPEVPQDARILVYKLGSSYEPGQIVAYRGIEQTLLGRVADVPGDLTLVLSRSTGQVTIDTDDVIGRVILTTR